MQDPVDAQADEGQLTLGLEMDVRSPLLERVAQDVVEGLHHRGRRGVQLGAGQELLVAEVDRPHAGGGELLLGALQARLQVVEALVDGLDVGARGHDPLHVEPRDPLDVVGGEGREGVVHGDRDLVRALRDRHQAVLAGEGRGQALGHDVDVEVERVDLDVGQPGVVGEGLRDLDLVGEAELLDRLLDSQRPHPGGAPHALRLLGGEHPAGDEDGEQVGRLGRGRHDGPGLARRWAGHVENPGTTSTRTRPSRG